MANKKLMILACKQGRGIASEKEKDRVVFIGELEEKSETLICLHGVFKMLSDNDPPMRKSLSYSSSILTDYNDAVDIRYLSDKEYFIELLKFN